MKKTTHKMYFVWHEDEEQAYLESMAKQGWLLSSYSPLTYMFKSCEPDDYIYQFDYSNETARHYAEKQGFLESCGWTFAARFSGWRYYYAKRNDVVSTQLITDYESLQMKYNQLLKFMAVVFVFNLGIVGIHFFNTLHNDHPQHIGLLNLALLVPLGYAMYKISQRMKHYRKV